MISYRGKDVFRGFGNHLQAEDQNRSIFFSAEITKFLYSENSGFPCLLSPYYTSLIFHSGSWREATSRVAGLHFLDLLFLLILMYCSLRL
jgi:hypothetical protein